MKEFCMIRKHAPLSHRCSLIGAIGAPCLDYGVSVAGASSHLFKSNGFLSTPLISIKIYVDVGSKTSRGYSEKLFA